MVCLAITRGGWGDVLLFDTERQARLDVVVQDGDAILPTDQALMDEYNLHEWARLMRLAGVTDVQTVDAIAFLSPMEARTLRRGMLSNIWRGLLGRAKPPPDDLESIRAMVARNRLKEMKMSESEAIGETEVKEKSTGDLNPTDTVKFGMNEKGESYGPDNIPYHEGSKRAERFLLVRDGETVRSNVEGGLTPARLKEFADRGHIVIAG